MRNISNEVFSQYSRVLDRTNYCYNYYYYGDDMFLFLKAREQYFNDLLKSNGHVLLNDVYESIGLSRILEYYDIGWLYNEENPVGDNFIDFGIYNLSDLINSMPDEIIIDFNVDGVIRY